MKRYTIGIDECGRGAWAGAMVVCAFAVEEGGTPLPAGVQDSKLFRGKKGRERLLAIGRQLETDRYRFCLQWGRPEEVDDFGVHGLWARLVRLAARSLYDRLVDEGAAIADVVIDGAINPLRREWLGGAGPRALVGADGTVPAVSAASCLAKTRQLEYMADMAKMYPQYGFETGAGYGTKKHREALLAHGVSPIHRKSFSPMRGMQKVLAPARSGL